MSRQPARVSTMSDSDDATSIDDKAPVQDDRIHASFYTDPFLI